VISQISFHTGFGFDQDLVCEVINDMLFFIYSFIIFLNFTFLWIRQRTFYSNRMLNIGYSKFLCGLSSSSLALVSTAGLIVVVSNIYPTNYVGHPSGCLFESKFGTMLLISTIIVGIFITYS